MLILTRKVGQTVVIDGGITITSLGCDGRSIRIGIDAPPEIRIDRGERLEKEDGERIISG